MSIRSRMTIPGVYDHESRARKLGLIDDGKPGRGGRVRRYTPAELEAYAKQQGVTVATGNKRPSTPNSRLWQVGKRPSRKGK